MTICIAAICDDGKAVVATSDRMITSEPVAIQFEHNAPKIYDVTSQCVVLSAGNALAHTKVVRGAQDKLKGLTNPPVELVTNLLKDAYQTERRTRAESLYLKPRGMDLEDFYRAFIRTIPGELASLIDGRIERANFGLSLIIAGVDGEGAHIYGVADPGVADCYDSLGFHAIGSGQTHAITMLAMNFNSSAKQDEMIKHVYDVKRKAEVAPGVGKQTDMAVITEKGIKKVNVKNL